MSGTVAQTQVSAFTSPTNGDALDATVVKANDNATRAAHNTHDADATIHVQTSLLAGRPAAGTAGRLWLTSDGLRMYYDSGSAWNELAYLPLSGGTLTGAVTLPNTVAVLGRNAANTGNVTLVYADASNQVNVSAGNTILLNGSTQIAGPLTFDTDGGRDIGNVGTNRPRNIYVAGAIAAASLSTSGSATVGGTFNVTGTATLAGTFFHSGTSVGFYGAGASTQQSVTGSRTGKDALALQLLACLAQLGLVANNTTP